MVVAVLVAAGSWARSRLCRSGQCRGGPPGSDTDGFEALWPEASLSAAQPFQERVEGTRATPTRQCRGEPTQQTLLFGTRREVLGWPDPIAGVMATDNPDTVRVSIFGLTVSCTGRLQRAPARTDRRRSQPRAIRALRRRRDLERHRASA